MNNSEHFGACCNLLSASEQKLWPFNWRKVRKKSWPMMTSKYDPRGHPGLKLCVHVSVMGYYRFINFHRNRRGSGIFLGDFTWNDPYQSYVRVRSRIRDVINLTYDVIEVTRYHSWALYTLNIQPRCIKTRDAEPEPEPEPEPPEPTHFGRSRSRSRSRRNGLLGAGAGAGAVKNGAAPAPKRDTIVARKKNSSKIKRNSRAKSLPKFVINN